MPSPRALHRIVPLYVSIRRCALQCDSRSRPSCKAAQELTTARRAGPFVLDLGDMLYAPNCFRDGRGRQIMLAWLQEHSSREGAVDYSGCITLPRVLTLAGVSPLHGHRGTCHGQSRHCRCVDYPCHAAGMRGGFNARNE